MDDLVLARAIHVIAVLFWIGGVGFVTWVVMPALRASERRHQRLHQLRPQQGVAADLVAGDIKQRDGTVGGGGLGVCACRAEQQRGTCKQAHQTIVHV